MAGEGTVTAQTTMHGKELTRGWVPVMVKEISLTVRPWQEYPTHSDEVERGSFVAWPVGHLRQKVPPKSYSREAELLRDNLHPDKSVSPPSIVSRNRQLRSQVPS